MTRNAVPWCSLTSYRVQICGCVSCEIARASRSNRSRNCGSAASVSGRTLIATVRSSRVSRALYTSPMPPAPSSDRISYAPRRTPADKDIRSRLYGETGANPPEFATSHVPSTHQATDRGITQARFQTRCGQSQGESRLIMSSRLVASDSARAAGHHCGVYEDRTRRMSRAPFGRLRHVGSIRMLGCRSRQGRWRPPRVRELTCMARRSLSPSTPVHPTPSAPAWC